MLKLNCKAGGPANVVNADLPANIDQIVEVICEHTGRAGHLPTTDGRELTLSRCTQPEPEHRMLLDQLQLSLPGQPPPKITVAQARQATPELVPQWRPTGLAQVKSTT